MKKVIVMFVAFSFLVTCGLRPGADVFARDLPSASSYDPATGNTTTVEEDADGGRTRTVTDSEGNVISKGYKPPPRALRKRRGSATPGAEGMCCREIPFFGPFGRKIRAKEKLEKAKEAVKKRKEAAKEALIKVKERAIDAITERKAEIEKPREGHIEHYD